MLFKQIHLEGIKAGTIDLAYRCWSKEAVHAGSRIKTSVGLVEIKSIGVTDKDKIKKKDAERAGYNSVAELLQTLKPFKDQACEIYRIEVTYFSEDPRIALREQAKMSDEELEEIKEKLARLNNYSKEGAWTQKVLLTITDHPRMRAIDIAKLTGYEKDWLKLNIRKLKNLGLTISHEIGYEISPRGSEYIERALTKRKKS